MSGREAKVTMGSFRLRTRGVASLLQGLRKRFGEGTATIFGEKMHHRGEGFSTGSPALDEALGCGGFPRSRIVEVFGGEGSGKSTLALQAIARCQESGAVAAFIDVEHAFDPGYAQALGVRLDRLLVSHPDCGEQALEIVEALAGSGSVDLVVVDSVAALVPREELEGALGETNPGLQARLMSQALRKLPKVLARSGTSVVFLNQIRMKIGGAHGPVKTTAGGLALRFYASMRLELRKAGRIRKKDGSFFTRSSARVVKNKLAPPFGEAVLEFPPIPRQSLRNQT